MTDRLLLDTHIALWLDSGDDRLRVASRALIEGCWQNGGTILVSGTTLPPTGCTAVAGAFTGNQTKLIAIDRGASVSYSLPIYAAPGRTLEILSIQSTGSAQDLDSEFSISTCPNAGSETSNNIPIKDLTCGFPLPAACAIKFSRLRCAAALRRTPRCAAP